MGTAIRHTVRKLERQGARRKVMLVISDGYPQDIDYGPIREDRQYGIHDTAQALREAELAHIQTFCVTIDRAGHDYLRDMCPEGRYLIIDEVGLVRISRREAGAERREDRICLPTGRGATPDWNSPTSRGREGSREHAPAYAGPLGAGPAKALSFSALREVCSTRQPRSPGADVSPIRALRAQVRAEA
jgi:hypothetical protein